MSRDLPAPVASPFAARYGPWALVAGASEGLGAAFASSLARRGVHVVLVARRADVLGPLAESIRATHGVEAIPLPLDLAAPDAAARALEACGEREIGLVVYNAALSPIGPLVETPLPSLLAAVDVNVRGPLAFAHAFGGPMVARGRGGLVLMSSLAGEQGAPRIATYAATKAFDTALGQGLWAELSPRGVDVVTCIAGATRTPSYLRSSAGDAPGTLDPDVVAERALEGLGRGPVVVPGAVNGLAALVMRRLLPRRVALSIMAKNTKELKG